MLLASLWSRVPGEAHPQGGVQGRVEGQEPRVSDPLQVFARTGVKPTQLRRKNGGEMDDGLGEEHPIYECITPLRSHTATIVNITSYQEWLPIHLSCTWLKSC